MEDHNIMEYEIFIWNMEYEIMEDGIFWSTPVAFHMS